MKTRIILTITHKAPIPDLIDKVANRIWSLQGVEGADAALDDLVKFLDEDPKLEQPTEARAAMDAQVERVTPSPSYRADYPTSNAELDAENKKAKADERLYGVGVSVNGWHVPAAKVACWGMSKAVPSQGLAAAWDEGYAAGVNDERISESNTGVAGFDAKVNPARENPHRRTHPQPTEPAPKRPPNCGTGHCSCIECVMEPAPSTVGERTLPERDQSKPAEAQGLFRKFNVQRTDGSDRPGGKHHGCEYFVLDVDHDPHAKSALQAYAAACAQSHTQLSEDLIARHGSAAIDRITQEQIREVIGQHLTSMYACTRVWEAWSVGTMSEDDFVPAGETEFADDLANTIAALLQSTALPDHSEQHLDMAATPKIGCVQHDCAECQARAALPVGELTNEQADAIQCDSDVRRHLEYYYRLPIDQTAIELVKKIASHLAAARPQPVLEPLTDDPLQGAVDWFLQADGEFFCVATVQRTLRIGYNRAKRLCDIAKERAAHGITQGGKV